MSRASSEPRPELQFSARRTARRASARVAQALPALRWVRRWDQQWLRPRLLSTFQDRRNAARYGPDAPRYAERLWVDPMAVRHSLAVGGPSARVVTEWPSSDEQPIDDDPVLEACIARWVRGLAWEATGEVDRMERAIELKGPIKGCRTRMDILERCARLDEIFATIRREGRVRPQREVEHGVFREFGGIGMHVGPGGIPVRGTNGRHRFAMARILEIPRIPVRVGLVHHYALGQLPALRDPRS